MLTSTPEPALTAPPARDRRWHAAPHVPLERDGITVLLAPDAPHWVATDPRGAFILSALDGSRTLDEVAGRYGQRFGLEAPAARHHVDRLVADARRRGFVSSEPWAKSAYEGRERHLNPRLRELWLHTNNSCNLSCEHCLVSSGPDGERGMDGSSLLALIDEGAALGADRFYLTGGEPLERRDAFDLVERITRHHGREAVVLTNGTLLAGAVLDRLKTQDQTRLHLQVSLDGASEGVNDALRGTGTHRRIVAGIRTLVEAGFAPTVSAVVTRSNVGEMVDMVRLVARLGARAWHLIWVHRKGRWAELNGAFVPPEVLLGELRRAQAEAGRLGVTIDNVEAFRHRVNGAAGTRIDLSSAGVESVCVYADGRVYPSAATVQYAALELGRWTGGNLGDLLDSSTVARDLRALSVVSRPVCESCQFRFLCGGGDVEHSYSFGLGQRTSRPFDHLDPYCDLYQGLLADGLFSLAEAGRRRHRTDTGFGAPVLFHAMGEGNLACGPGGDLEAHAPVHTSRSNCVVGVGIERPRALVQSFYAKAAETPQPELCCPTGYDASDTAHIPTEVLERFYGCGGPMSVAEVTPGETVVDLGCGAGIDVFIAARKVGPGGRAIGIDMTDPMLGVAGESRGKVAERLGYDVVEFHKGYLEEVPLPDGTADLVTSNCVINLSPDKRRVFAEMWRLLKDHGRMVVSDIVSEGPLPPALRVNAHLWGECVSGALAEDEFRAEVERAGFYGVSVLRRQFWKEVEGHRVFSVTVRGYKLRKSSGCLFAGHRAVYLGPWVSVTDEEGHLFPRGEAVDVCTDTVAKLSRAPYRGSFEIREPGENAGAIASGPSCAPGCC